MDESWAWVALALVPEVGWNARRYHDLLAMGTPVEVFRASRRDLGTAVGEDVAGGIVRFDAEGAIAAQRALAVRCGARLVTLRDDAYPAILRSIPLPPPFLLVRGGLAREDGLAAAIVGSRQATPYGLRTAERLGGDLAARGVTVVSGLARGIDGAAHRGALGAKGRTVAVVGCGVDVIYPAEHGALGREIVAAGALVSQFPMGSGPLPQHFPMRNRVIAGLTLGTVVVEAGRLSGALITARCAGELGREVYAVPGNVSSAVSEGANRLIQDGAKLVRDWSDVVAEWPAVWRRALRPVDAEARPGQETADGAADDAGERRLLALLGDEPVAIDAVIERSGLSSGQVAAGLMTLELRGAVRQLPGRRYVRG